MARRSWLSTLALTPIAILLGACNLPMMQAGNQTAATNVVQTISAIQTDLAASQIATASAPPPSAAAAPEAAPSATAQPVPTASNPVVHTTALCWTGPGSAYPVVSAVKAGTQLQVLGVGSQVGWFVVKNPTYGDRCWVEAKYLTLDPYFNTSGMQVFNPPPTPGPTETPIPTPT